MKLHLRDVQAFFTNASGHQGVEGTRPEVSQHLLLLCLLHANPICLSRGLPNEDPAKGETACQQLHKGNSKMLCM